MAELNPLRDLAAALAEQSDLPRFPRKVPGRRPSIGPVIAVPDDCWCGRPIDHDWVGREDGAPHPRYP